MAVVPSGQFYDELAVRVLRQLLDVFPALLRSEIEARAADGRVPGFSNRVEPVHLSNGLKTLLAAGEIVETAELTRGGRVIPLVHRPRHVLEQRGQLREFEAMAGRKRLLEARYLGWAEGHRNVPSLIGRGGESAVQRSLREAAMGTYLRLEQPQVEMPSITELYGYNVPIGPLDNAARYLTDDRDEITYLIEVKNNRSWLYTAAEEHFQLLAKAAQLQQLMPERFFVPVLVCRRANHTLFKMAKDIGFYVIQTFAHYIYAPYFSDSPERLERLQEVNNELRYNLILAIQPVSNIVKHFSQYLPGIALEQATVWRDVGSLFVDEWVALRSTTSAIARRDVLVEIDAEISGQSHYSGGWATHVEGDEEEGEGDDIEYDFLEDD